jgi:hypothetical protein
MKHNIDTLVDKWLNPSNLFCVKARRNMLSPDSLAPTSVYVDHPIGIRRQGREKDGIPTITSLFREKSLLEEGLDVVHSRIGKRSDFKVVSAACSVGAEVDSLLVLQNTSQHRGQMAIKGFDINPEVVASAREGRYVVPAGTSSLAERLYLESRGFFTAGERTAGRE